MEILRDQQLGGCHMAHFFQSDPEIEPVGRRLSIFHVVYSPSGYPPVTSSTRQFTGQATKCTRSPQGLFIHYGTSRRPTCKSSSTCSCSDQKLAAKRRKA